MITELNVKNYKSIVDDTIELSNVNVLIGENGSGKSNYLEAVAMLSAAKDNRLDINGLSEKGVRVTKPNLTMSSFLGKASKKAVAMNVLLNLKEKEYQIKSKLVPQKVDDIYSEWNETEDISINGLALIALLFIDKKRQEKKAEDILNMVNDPSLKDIGSLNKKIIIDAIPAISLHNYTKDYLIYNLDTQALRGINNNSRTMPLGIYGEGLDVLLGDFSKEEWEELMEYSSLISWLDDIVIDKSDKLKFDGHKLGRSTSILYFRDKYMSKKNNIFAAENSNEGVLHILFYLALFISKKTPKFFAIDNIETALNPKLCRVVMKEIAKLAIKHNKQVIITTHNPAILDGLNLHDDKQRLFVIKRSDEGYTKSERIKLKPTVEGEKNLKLSEMWMRGYLGGLPTNF